MLRLLLIALAHGDGCPGRATGTDQQRKGIHKHDQRQAQANTGQRCCADALNMADVNAVNDIIKQVHKLRHHRRHSHFDHQF